MNKLILGLAVWSLSGLAGAAAYDCGFYYDSPTTDLVSHFLIVDDHTPQTVIFENSVWYTAEKTQGRDGAEILAVSIRRDGSDAASFIPWGSPFVGLVYDSYATPSDLYEIACKTR